jgi:medium-chain acyl-[acyl-carrier-protein] hydrolase
MSASLRNRWFRRYPVTQSPSARLIGFHHAGGSASLFRPWSASLPPWIEVIGVQLPGREDRAGEVPFSSVIEVVEELEWQITTLFDLPVYFFGHSMGALIAFELTRALRRSARCLPAHLFVSGRCAAHLSDPLPGLSRLPEREFVEAVQRFGGTPSEVFAHRELMALVIPLLRADFGLYESYRYRDERPLDIPITAFAGMDDHAAPAASAEPWSAHTTEAFRSYLLPGGHFFVNSARPSLLAAIAGTVQRSAPGDSGVRSRAAAV